MGRRGRLQQCAVMMRGARPLGSSRVGSFRADIPRASTRRPSWHLVATAVLILQSAARPALADLRAPDAVAGAGHSAPQSNSPAFADHVPLSLVSVQEAYAWLSEMLDQIDLLISLGVGDPVDLQIRAYARIHGGVMRALPERRTERIRLAVLAEVSNPAPPLLGQQVNAGAEALAAASLTPAQAGAFRLRDESRDASEIIGKAGAGLDDDFASSGGVVRGGEGGHVEQPGRGKLGESVYYFDWPWSGRPGKNMFYWVVGPPSSIIVGVGLLWLAGRMRDPAHST